MRRREFIGTSAAAATVLAAAPGSAAAPGTPSATPGDGNVHLPARTIEPPRSISEKARDQLRRGANAPVPDFIPASDKAAWCRSIAEHDGAMLRRVGGGDATLPGLSVETRVIGGVTVYVVAPVGQATAAKPHLCIHGGGWTSLGGKINRVLTQVQAQSYGGIVYGVDYRMPPDHPYPAPLDDCLAVYRAMTALHDPRSILVSGGSAGANLAAALMLRARDAGLPKPGALLLDTPIVDLTCTGDSLRTNELVDTNLKVWRPDANVALYANGADLADPYLSPLKGDLTRGFPPTYLRTGTRDLFLSDTVRFHAALRKAGCDADLYVGEAMPHSGFGYQTPEGDDARADTLRWLDKHWRWPDGPRR